MLDPLREYFDNLCLIVEVLKCSPFFFFERKEEKEKPFFFFFNRS